MNTDITTRFAGFLLVLLLITITKDVMSAVAYVNIKHNDSPINDTERPSALSHTTICYGEFLALIINCETTIIYPATQGVITGLDPNKVWYLQAHAVSHNGALSEPSLAVTYSFIKPDSPIITTYTGPLTVGAIGADSRVVFDPLYAVTDMRVPVGVPCLGEIYPSPHPLITAVFRYLYPKSINNSMIVICDR